MKFLNSSLLILLPAMALNGCSDTPAEKAMKEYKIAETAIIDPAGKKCAAARKVVEALAEEGNADEYRTWELTAYNDCFEANGR